MTDAELVALYFHKADPRHLNAPHVEALRRVAEGVWDEAVATSRSILARRSPAHYETDIDLIVEPNPYAAEQARSSSSTGEAK